MVTLCIDTATEVGTVAIARNGDVAAAVTWRSSTRHGENLFGRIDAVLNKARVSRSEITLVGERRMVAEYLWPGGVQPVTHAPMIQIEDGRVALTSETPGASLGYRVEEGATWTVYTEPIDKAELGEALEVVAHRIGYAPARSQFELD